MCCKITVVKYTPLIYIALFAYLVWGIVVLLYMQMSGKSANKKGEKQADKKI